MIYDFPDKLQLIKQGDIFYPLPSTVLNMEKMVPLNGEPEEISWEKLQEIDKDLLISTKLKKTWGIVATQDCDALRAPFISFFQISPFEDVWGQDLSPNTEKRVRTLTQKSRLNSRMFYLPKDSHIGFDTRMSVDFHKVFQIRLSDLKQNIHLRKGRLNKVAYQHYRESIAQYFRRYPYDEWYSLDRDEFKTYCEGKESITPCEWQKDWIR